jgi:glycosyltransferase involved in cell wall biosynthesis
MSVRSLPLEAAPRLARTNAFQSIKVVLVYPMDLFGSKEGGAENFVRGFVKHAPEDFDLEVVGVTCDRSARPVGRSLDVAFAGRPVRFRPVIFVRDENRRGRVPVSLRFTLALLPSRLRSARTVYLFNRIEPVLAFRRKGNAAIGFLHTDILRQCAPGKTEILWARWPRAYALLERWAVGRLDAVLTASRSTLDRYLRLDSSGEAKMLLFPNWVDPEVFPFRTGPKSEPRALLRRVHPRLPQDDPWVLFVGRLQPVKAPVLAIDGFRRYRETGAPGVLIMIGEGNLMESLGSYVRRMGLAGHVFLLGDKRQAELSLFYRAADVLLLTSHFEAGPCCVLEALGSGTPVISTDVGEVRRVVQEGRSGEIVDGEARAVGEALGRVLGAPETYAPAACLESVANHTPRKVLAPVFERIRLLEAGFNGRADEAEPRSRERSNHA